MFDQIICKAILELLDQVAGSRFCVGCAQADMCGEHGMFCDAAIKEAIGYKEDTDV
jgi:hypothetical protein